MVIYFWGHQGYLIVYRIQEHLGNNCLEIGRDDFEFTPFKENGGIGKVYQLFGEELWGMLEELNEVLAA